MENNNVGTQAEPFRTGCPSPWTEHLCGAARPTAPTRSTGVPLATRGAVIAAFFVRPQTTPAARAPQAPAAALEEPATATRVTPAVAASPAPATAVSAVPAQLVAPQVPSLAFLIPCNHPPLFLKK